VVRIRSKGSALTIHLGGDMADQTTKKKMNVLQLTFLVTINMMGSGIIMLPTNMAKVGAISLL
jgi:putrescine:ornithine antiporter